MAIIFFSYGTFYILLHSNDPGQYFIKVFT